MIRLFIFNIYFFQFKNKLLKENLGNTESVKKRIIAMCNPEKPL